MEFDLIRKYRNTNNSKLILLDYDGTLVDYSSIPDQALPTERVLSLLRKLIQKPSLKVVIITGRRHLDIENLIGNLSIDIIAEHGAMIKENGNWKEHIKTNGSWKKAILPFIHRLVSERPDSFIEEKKFSLTWHYRNLEPIGGYIFSRELIRTLSDKVIPYDLKIVDGNKIIEIMPSQMGKGNAIQHLLEKICYDLILSIGDDKTDEDMFTVLANNKNSFTIKVGYGNTSAKHKLDSVNDVLTFLELLSI
ncbi:MAG: trehalose-phosphatase [Bacteroidota bacterium]